MGVEAAMRQAYFFHYVGDARAVVPASSGGARCGRHDSVVGDFLAARGRTPSGAWAHMMIIIYQSGWNASRQSSTFFPPTSPKFDAPQPTTIMPLASIRSWLRSVSDSKANYWSTYVVDVTLLTFFLAWDRVRLHVAPIAALAQFLLGLGIWTLSEYAFHRWGYHMGIPIAREGHDRHHEDPLAYIAMPCVVTPVLFLPPQLLIAGWFGVRGISSLLAGWFGGFIAYSVMHHCLHHYKWRFAWFRHLQSQHRIHHALPETNYGVTMRFWDRVFRTEFTKDTRL